MQVIKAQGTCACGEYCFAFGTSEEDALIVLQHYHYVDFKHAFNGRVTFRKEDTETKPETKSMNDRQRR